jgi:hypothetical protein
MYIFVTKLSIKKYEYHINILNETYKTSSIFYFDQNIFILDINFY